MEGEDLGGFFPEEKMQEEMDEVHAMEDPVTMEEEEEEEEKHEDGWKKRFDGFNMLQMCQPLSVAPFPTRKPVTCEVFVNADLYGEMDYKDEEKRRGDMGEYGFVRLCRAKGITVEYATAKEDFEFHIDYYLTFPDARKSVDVKGRKKIARGDEECADGMVWLELHGAGERSKGWLQGGRADLIAFETLDSYVFFSREKLNAAVRGKNSFIDMTAIVTNPHDAENKVYKRGDAYRNGKHDATTRVSLARLQQEFPHAYVETWVKSSEDGESL